MKVIKLSKYWPLFWLGAGAITLGKYVFIRNDLYTRDIFLNALLAHEQVHVDQQAKANLFVWLFKYLVSSTFRKEMELEAYAKEYLFCKNANEHGLYNFNLSPELWARRMTGVTYLWMISYDEALAFFQKLV